MISLPETRRKSTETLKAAGLFNPLRMVRLLKEAIAFFDLDLSGLTVLTEAASAAYVTTPVLALMAGAKRVIGLTRSSPYATVEEVLSQTRALERLCELGAETEIRTDRSLDLFAQADIVTNLGFVRPITADLISAMKPAAVLPLMAETWEVRPQDLDLEACMARGIPVFGTNEDFPGLEIFSYIGLLCAKILYEAQIEVHKSKLILVSSDKFGATIEMHLKRAGAHVRIVSSEGYLRDVDLAASDAIIVADYTRRDEIIGPEGNLNPARLARVAPQTAIIHLAGKIDLKAITEHGIPIYPEKRIGSRRMTLTLAHLGPKPLIDLHAAGLKVGELAARHRQSGSLFSPNFAIHYKGHPLGQPVQPPGVEQL